MTTTVDVIVLGTGSAAQSVAYSCRAASASKPSPDAHRGTHGQTWVERAAARDSIGDQVQTLISPKCTFSGVVPIELQRVLDSGIRLVECPDCARTRSLSPHKGVLRFPSHEKRKTHTPNTEPQWARGETAWGVVGG
jgi:hypothetical protein